MPTPVAVIFPNVVISPERKRLLHLNPTEPKSAVPELYGFKPSNTPAPVVVNDDVDVIAPLLAFSLRSQAPTVVISGTLAAV